MKKLTLEGGIEVTVPAAPPPSFDPFTARPEDLKKYGFPAVPDDPQHLERYKRVFGQIKNKLNYIEPTFRVNTDRKHGPRKQQKRAETKHKKDAGTETSTNWSGAVVFAPAGDSFKWVEGDWVVPDVDASTENQWYYSASWIGIDGDGSGDVFQAGVECEAYRSGASVTRNIYPWWEWFPIAEVQITNFAVSPGDMITMVLCSANGAGSTTGTVSITNRTTGATTSVTLTAPAGTQLKGNSAEWIVEAPTVGGTQSAVADYGQVFFNVCEAVTVKGVTVGGGTGDNMNMVVGNSVVSDGSLITSTVVECEYVGALP
jgi:hypothetical protein